jgi:hypothetical protein
LDYHLGETWISSNGNECSVARANERFNWIKDNLWEDAVAVIVVSPIYFSGLGTTPETSPESSVKLAATLQELLQTTGRKPILLQGIPPIKDYDGQTVNINKVDRTSTSVEEYIDRVYTGLEEADTLDIFEYFEVSGHFIGDETDLMFPCQVRQTMRPASAGRITRLTDDRTINLTLPQTKGHISCLHQEFYSHPSVALIQVLSTGPGTTVSEPTTRTVETDALYS